MKALRSHPLFRGVADSTLETLAASAHARVFEAGDVILSEGDEELAFFVLLSGSVKVFYRSPDGDEVIVKIFGAPAAFGEMKSSVVTAPLE